MTASQKALTKMELIAPAFMKCGYLETIANAIAKKTGKSAEKVLVIRNQDIR